MVEATTSLEVALLATSELDQITPVNTVEAYTASTTHSSVAPGLEVISQSCVINKSGFVHERLHTLSRSIGKLLDIETVQFSVCTLDRLVVTIQTSFLAIFVLQDSSPFSNAAINFSSGDSQPRQTVIRYSFLPNHLGLNSLNESGRGAFHNLLISLQVVFNLILRVLDLDGLVVCA